MHWINFIQCIFLILKESTMRRKDRQISQSEALTLLEKGEFGVLSTVDGENRPYGVPINYCLLDDSIYFHCALEGKKIDNIQFQPVVSFCVVGHTCLIPEKFSTKYESVIVWGEVEEVFAEEKIRALKGLIKKYASEYEDKSQKYIASYLDKTRVFKIKIKEISGKARK